MRDPATKCDRHTPNHSHSGIKCKNKQAFKNKTQLHISKRSILQIIKIKIDF